MFHCKNIWDWVQIGILSFQNKIKCNLLHYNPTYYHIVSEFWFPRIQIWVLDRWKYFQNKIFQMVNEKNFFVYKTVHLTHFHLQQNCNNYIKKTNCWTFTESNVWVKTFAGLNWLHEICHTVPCIKCSAVMMKSPLRTWNNATNFSDMLQSGRGTFLNI